MTGMAHHLTTHKQISTPAAVSPLARDEVASISNIRNEKGKIRQISNSFEVKKLSDIVLSDHLVSPSQLSGNPSITKFQNVQFKANETGCEESYTIFLYNA
ncbi:hypothetical protein X798_01032 [Onchocerca flexuosa]|uniref:Uncharacterized protein n=1 Tax=Onchocerca flexuosa TaxID=387005 RepID=A0A238C2Z5_9BILA|nr:hypothetical protein X798_01032 [Onchocerca flexuosa]